MKLSIMITTIPDRYDLMVDLYRILMQQMQPGVEVLVNCDTRINADGMSQTSDTVRREGFKRNSLLQASTGEYVVWIDDDDLVPDYYVVEVLKAIDKKPDCIGYWNECHLIEGDKIIDCLAKHTNETIEWGEKGGVYLRTITFLNPVKRSIALQCQFDSKFGDDQRQSMAMRKFLKSEVFIDKVMYMYYPLGTRKI